MDQMAPQRIRELSLEFDDALARRDVEKVMFFFSDEPEIELLDVKLRGREAARGWLDWLYAILAEIDFRPISMTVTGNVFIEEYELVGRTHEGREVRSKQAEVLVYEGERIKSLRIYFDRIPFILALVGPVQRAMINRLNTETYRGLDIVEE